MSGLKRRASRRASARSTTTTFGIGDHVAWNSEAGRVSGKIIAIHTADFVWKGHLHHASHDDPQYEIRSDKTDHVAAHRGRVLEHVRDEGDA